MKSKLLLINIFYAQATLVTSTEKNVLELEKLEKKHFFLLNNRLLNLTFNYKIVLLFGVKFDFMFKSLIFYSLCLCVKLNEYLLYVCFYVCVHCSFIRCWVIK